MLRPLGEHRRGAAGPYTALVRELAEALVDARRANFTTDAGEPDWLGRSYVYRVWVGELYREAGYSRAEMNTLQAAVRDHVEAVLRQQLPPDKRQELGLISKSPRERSKARRARRSALLNAFMSAEDGTGSPLVALHAVEAVLEHLTDRTSSAWTSRAAPPSPGRWPPWRATSTGWAVR